MQQPGVKREMGGNIFQMGGPGTTGPPAGDDPASARSQRFGGAKLRSAC